MQEIKRNGRPIPVRVRGILFSLSPGEDVQLVATQGGVQRHDSDEDMNESLSLRQAVEQLVLVELEDKGNEALKRVLSGEVGD